MNNSTENINDNHAINYNFNSNFININKKQISCWNCSSLFYPDDNTDVMKCPNCNKYNSVPKTNISRNINNPQRQNLNNLENNSTIDISENIITCPYCFTKNLFHIDSEELICYNCSKIIKHGFRNSFQINSRESLKNNIVGWRIVPSQQQFLSPTTPFLPSPFTPRLQPDSNTDYLLKKILKNIKKQKSEFNTLEAPNFNKFNIPNFIPFPVVDYNNRINYMDEYSDKNRNNNIRLSEIRYLPIKTENEKPKKDGYKITIRKKKGNGKGISKSTIFEKVFYFK